MVSEGSVLLNAHAWLVWEINAPHRAPQQQNEVHLSVVKMWNNEREGAPINTFVAKRNN